MLISNINGSHKEQLQLLIADCDERVVIVSPYLASNMLNFLEGFEFTGIKTIELITTFKENDMEQCTKPYQIRDFVEFFEKYYPSISVIIHVDNKLHGKLYIFYSMNLDKKAIFTSANFTNNGMSINNEWGVLVQKHETIENVMNEVDEAIDYREITKNQISRACIFADETKKLNPDLKKNTKINSDIMKRVYSDHEETCLKPQYFLKPIGHQEKPVTIEGQEDFSELHQNLHFSKMPKAVKKGDYIITTAVGAGSLLSYFRVTGSPQYITDAQLNGNPDLERWPWFLEARNNSQEFGKSWWKYNIRRQDALNDFISENSEYAVTFAGSQSLGALNQGADRLRLTQEFGEYLIKRLKT